MKLGIFQLEKKLQCFRKKCIYFTIILYLSVDTKDK